MISTARGLAAVVVALAAVPGWLAPPAAAGQPTGTVEAVREVVFDDCTFKLINNYSPTDGRQYVRTRQVRSEETCRFGARNGTIRVRACFEGRDGAPVDCSDWLRPTSEQPHAESVITGAEPRSSIHFAEIRGEARRYDLAAPDVPPAPPQPPPPAPPAAPPAPPPQPAPTPTGSPTAPPSPAATSPAGQYDTVEQAATSTPPEVWEAASNQHPQTRYGLAAGLAAGGVALLGLGGAGIWFLRRRGSALW